MAGYADLLEALAAWLNVPVFQAEGVLSRITPTIDLQELVDLAAERGGVPGKRAAVYAATAPAVAAELPRVQLMNPANSGVNIRLQMILVSRTTAGFVSVGFQNSALATAGVNRYADQRIGITPAFVVVAPAGSITQDTDALTGIAAGDLLGFHRQGTSKSSWEQGNQITLPAGFGFRVVGATVNEALSVSIYSWETPAKRA